MDFQNFTVGQGAGGGEAEGGGDGAAGVMGRDPDAVALGEAADGHEGTDAAAVLHVGHDDIDGASAAEGFEAGNAVEGFAAGHAHGDLLADGAGFGGFFGSNGFLEPVELGGLEAAGEGDAGLDSEETVGVDHEFRAGAEGFADGVDAFDAEVDGDAAVEGSGFDGAEAVGPGAAGDGGKGVGGARFDGAVDVGVDLDGVADFSAEEVDEGLGAAFGFEVEEGLFEGADGGGRGEVVHGDAAAGGEDTADFRFHALRVRANGGREAEAVARLAETGEAVGIGEAEIQPPGARGGLDGQPFQPGLGLAFPLPQISQETPALHAHQFYMHESTNPVAQLVHLYIDGAFDRRELVERVVKLTGSWAAAMLALGGFEEMKAQATPVPPGIRVGENDPDLVVRDVTYDGLGSALFGHLAMPRRLAGQVPGVIVIHENRGLVEHIRDVTRRFAKAGYVALGVDLLSRQGGTAQFTEPTQQTQAYGRTTVEGRRADLIASLDFLKRQEQVIHDRIAVTGYCAGGANTWDLIVNVSEIRAAAPFYGAPPAAADLERLQTPVLAVYAERDRNLTRNMLAAATTLSTLQKVHGLLVYEGVGHAFHNDTGAAYNAEAARDAFAQTIQFFRKHLGA